MIEKYVARSAAAAHRAHPAEHERERDRREHLEEVLDPEVHDPPAPVVGDRHVRARRVEEADRVEERDRDRGVEEQVREAALVTLGLQRRLDARGHEDEPEHHPGDERDLPDAAELDVLVALVADEPGCPYLPRMPAQVPVSEPTTTTTSAPSSVRTSAFWPFGSRPPTAGPMKRPVASQQVAIQKTASWRCQVRVAAYGQDLREVDAVELVPLDREVGGHRAEHRLERRRGGSRRGSTAASRAATASGSAASSGAKRGASSSSASRILSPQVDGEAVPAMSSTTETMDQTSADGSGSFPASGSYGKFAV